MKKKNRVMRMGVILLVLAGAWLVGNHRSDSGEKRHNNRNNRQHSTSTHATPNQSSTATAEAEPGEWSGFDASEIWSYTGKPYEGVTEESHSQSQRTTAGNQQHTSTTTTARQTAARPTARPNDGGGVRPQNQSKELYVDGAYRIGGVSVVDINNGRTHNLGVVDLRPTLERIASGQKDRHDNDGTVYQNRSRALPVKQSGYYHEYVVRTPGVSGVGPQRLIIGKEGEIYYTPDHYDHFIRVEGE